MNKFADAVIEFATIATLYSFLVAVVTGIVGLINYFIC